MEIGRSAIEHLPCKQMRQQMRSEIVCKLLKVFGRGGGIRTPDPLLPKQMRYQAALRPDSS